MDVEDTEFSRDSRAPSVSSASSGASRSPDASAAPRFRAAPVQHWPVESAAPVGSLVSYSVTIVGPSSVDPSSTTIASKASKRLGQNRVQASGDIARLVVERHDDGYTHRRFGHRDAPTAGAAGTSRPSIGDTSPGNRQVVAISRARAASRARNDSSVNIRARASAICSDLAAAPTGPSLRAGDFRHAANLVATIGCRRHHRLQQHVR